jgi:hypothetical protein
MQGVARVLSATACALSLMLCCGVAGASANVVFKDADAVAVASATTATVPGVTVGAGVDRFLAVTVSTKENATVTGVTYAGQVLTSRAATQTSGATNGTGARVELWTLSAPVVGTGSVTVTFNTASPAVVGVTSYTGVDGLAPLYPVASGADDVSANAASLVLSGTSANDAMVGAISYGSVANTSAPFTQGSTDTVVADLRYSDAAGPIRGGGATRSGNTGQNQAVNTGIVWRWSFTDGTVRSPYAQVLAGLRAATLVVPTAPTVTTGDATGTTRTAATLGGDVTGDGNDSLAERGVVYVQGTGTTPARGGAGVTELDAASASTGAFTVTAAGLQPGTTYTYRAFATNSVGTAYGAAKTFATAVDHAPVADAGGPYAIDEGSGLALSAAGSSDADGDVLSYAWDLDHDGQFDDATGASPTLTADQVAALGLGDGPASRELDVRVSDGFTHTDAAANVTVANVVPTATVSDDGPVVEGSDAHVTLTAPSDPSTADVAAGFRYAYDVDGDGNWDIGDGTYANGTTAASATIPTTDSGTIAVKARIVDEDGGATDYTQNVTVTNAAPTATLANDGPVAEGSAANVSFSGAADPSAGDTTAGFHYAYDLDGDGNWDIGDGTYGGSVTAASEPVLSTDDGTITVRGAVVDKDDDSTTYTTTITVTNVAPTATVTAPTATPIDTALTFALSAADPSSVDAAGSFTYTVDWGDGTTATVTGPALAQATHTYTAPGAHTVKVVATDKDHGASAAASTTVTIPDRPAPPAGPGPDTGTDTTTTPAPAPAPVTGASTPTATPIIASGLSVSPRCVKASSATTRSVKLKYKLSGAATVRVTLQRANGSKATRKCPPLRGSKQDDGKYKANTYTPVSTQKTTGTSITIAKGAKNGAVGTASAAIATLRPQALLAKGQKLKAGTYLITVQPLDANGKALSTARVKFWVLKG